MWWTASQYIVIFLLIMKLDITLRFPLLVLLGIVVTISSTKGQAQSTDTIPGLFTTYRSEDKIYWEIPHELSGRDVMVTHTILEAAARKARNPEKKYGYSGDLFGPIVLRFYTNEREVRLFRPLYDRSVPSNPDHDIWRIARQRGDETLLMTFPAVERSDKCTRFDVTRLLTDSPFFLLSSVSFDLNIGAKLNASIQEIKGYEDKLLIQSRQSYLSGNGSSYQTDWLVGTCVSLLPSEPIDPIRRPDGSYFYMTKNDYTSDAYRETNEYIIKRWRLEVKPEDRARYDRGEKVTPIRPIVFYIDKDMPNRWVPYVKEAVEAWNIAFEAAGFKEAIRAYPIPKNSDMPIYDTAYPYISWKVSPQKNAYGPTPNEPRSGEIVSSHVGMFSSVLDMLQAWYFVQCGAVDERARNIDLPDDIMGELIKMAITHEIGHTLGLEHNFFASSIPTVDHLRDNAYLSTHGITSSVMDYVRCNYALRPGDTVDLRNRIARIGAYDLYSIEYIYRLFPGKTLAERERARNAWRQTGKAKPIHFFYDMRDVRAQAEDLGNDHVAVNAQGVANLKYLVSLPELWSPTDTRSLRVMQRRYIAMIEALKTWSEHIIQHFGGRRMNPSGQFPMWKEESLEYSRKAMAFVQEEVVGSLSWLFDEARLTGLDLDPKVESEEFCRSIISTLVGRIIHIARMEARGIGEVYTVAEYLDSLHTALYGSSNRSLSEADLKLKSILRRHYSQELRKLLDKETSTYIIVPVWRAISRISHTS